MNKIQIILIISLVFISVIMWTISAQQYNIMMSTMMMFYNPIALSLFTIIWTAGMAAMMFPAISPMVLLYDRLIKTNNNTSSSNDEASSQRKGEARASSLIVGRDNKEEQERMKKKILLSSVSFWSPYSFKMILFIGSYLLVWALTGIAILIGWSIPMNYFLTESFTSTIQNLVDVVFGVLLVISGLYQFSPLKTKCLGYCESPMSFFMRRWKSGMVGAVKMGTYHGLYCLGCCWPYFLLMVALGWMNLLWMALFAAIIFGEKVWIKGGRWIGRSAGVGFVILGVLALIGIIEVPTGDMTMADVTSSNNKDMEMDNGMNMGMEMDMGDTNDDNYMQMNMDTKGNDMVMNMK
jgi:predicted metal-binding membrane protein